MPEPVKPTPHRMTREGDSMNDHSEEIRPRVYQLGGCTGIIHSRLAWMKPEERRQWFREEQAKGNPILKQISRAIADCQRD